VAESRANDAASSLARLIQDTRAEIERRWVDQVQRDIVRAGPVEPTQLRDGISDYLQSMATMLSDTGKRGSGDEGRQAWATVARDHGINRVALGFDISQLLQEFFVLRDVIERLADERGLGSKADRDLTRIIDGAVAEAVAAYVEARDHEARSRHAENIGFLTHELKTPLTAAMLSAARLRSKRTAEQERLLDSLDRNHRRLS
jgi:signal transduction histidine kinase